MRNPANLVNSQLSFNRAPLTNEVGWEQNVFATNSALNGVINRSFNGGQIGGLAGEITGR